MLAKRPLNKKHTAWLAQIDEWKKKAPFAYTITQEIAGSDHMKDHLKGQEDQIILQQMVVEALYELTKGDAIITTGVGQHQMWAGQWYQIRAPAPVHHQRRAGLDGLWLSGGARHQGRASGQGSD